MLVFYHWLILPQTPLQSILTIWQQSTSLSLTLSPGEPAGGALKLKCCVVLLADGAPRPPPAPFGVAGGAAAAANTVALAAAAALVEPGSRHAWTCLFLAGLCLSNLGCSCQRPLHRPTALSRSRTVGRWGPWGWLVHATIWLSLAGVKSL